MPVMYVFPILCCEALKERDREPDISFTFMQSCPVKAVSEDPDNKLDGELLVNEFKKIDPDVLNSKICVLSEIVSSYVTINSGRLDVLVVFLDANLLTNLVLASSS
jgi:hypothetical protein